MKSTPLDSLKKNHHGDLYKNIKKNKQEEDQNIQMSANQNQNTVQNQQQQGIFIQQQNVQLQQQRLKQQQQQQNQVQKQQIQLEDQQNDQIQQQNAAKIQHEINKNLTNSPNQVQQRSFSPINNKIKQNIQEHQYASQNQQSELYFHIQQSEGYKEKFSKKKKEEQMKLIYLSPPKENKNFYQGQTPKRNISPLKSKESGSNQKKENSNELIKIEGEIQSLKMNLKNNLKDFFQQEKLNLNQQQLQQNQSPFRNNQLIISNQEVSNKKGSVSKNSQLLYENQKENKSLIQNQNYSSPINKKTHIQEKENEIIQDSVQQDKNTSIQNGNNKIQKEVKLSKQIINIGQKNQEKQQNREQELEQENSLLKQKMKILEQDFRKEIENLVIKEKENMKKIIDQYKQFIEQLIKDKQNLSSHCLELEVENEKLRFRVKELQKDNQQLSLENQEIQRKYIDLLQVTENRFLYQKDYDEMCEKNQKKQQNSEIYYQSENDQDQGLDQFLKEKHCRSICQDEISSTERIQNKLSLEKVQFKVVQSQQGSPGFLEEQIKQLEEESINNLFQQRNQLEIQQQNQHQNYLDFIQQESLDSEINNSKYLSQQQQQQNYQQDLENQNQENIQSIIKDSLNEGEFFQNPEMTFKHNILEKRQLLEHLDSLISDINQKQIDREKNISHSSQNQYQKAHHSQSKQYQNNSNYNSQNEQNFGQVVNSEENDTFRDTKMYLKNHNLKYLSESNNNENGPEIFSFRNHNSQQE